MSRILAALRTNAAARPDRPALLDGRDSLSHGELLSAVERLAAELRETSPGATALFADNGCAWAVADLALHVAGLPCVPLPVFFSPGQMEHTLSQAGIRWVLTDQPERLRQALREEFAAVEPFYGNLQRVSLRSRPSPAARLPEGTTKVTFTSGTTGEPRGVCLGRDQIEAVAGSLLDASGAHADDRHLCLLPLATLLDNIAGIYTPVLAGAVICVPPLAEVGLTGSSGLNVARMVSALTTWQATTVITVPQTLQAIVGATASGAPLPPGLRYVAVGGAPVSVALLELARLLGVPVHEGYGLSECGSVVAVNRAGEIGAREIEEGKVEGGGVRLGSVGKPLPHVRIAFAEDGEIMVHGVRWYGYLGGDMPADGQPVATGDTGHLDADGFLHVTGRKKNIFITSFGRNVAPEWVERELVVQNAILQAAVFGDGRPFNAAVVFPRPGTDAADIDAALRTVNRSLPDYAQVGAWTAAREPFSVANGMLTNNGRPRRDRILAVYAEQIDALHPTPSPTGTTS